MRIPISTRTLTRLAIRLALAAAILPVVAVFLQWLGLPVNWPDPPHTLYSEIAHLVG